MTTGSDAISYGLQIFPDSEVPADPIPFECGAVHRCCEMPDDAQMVVPIVQRSIGAPRIVEALSEHEPAGAAAITAALERANRYFADVDQPPLGDARYVLLVTDGAPICDPYAVCDADRCTSNIDALDGCPPDGPSCCDDLPAACLDDAASVDQIAALRAVGVTTIVMGLPGSERYSAVLQRLAATGGFERADGSSGYYAVGADTVRADLDAALAEISTLVLQPCRFAAPVDFVVDPFDAYVEVECEVVPQVRFEE